MNVLFEGNTKTGKDEWLTPPPIIHALGEFDLDPCAPIKRPWDTAKKHLTIEDNGLNQQWVGRVWCNPPYDDIENWLRRCKTHGNAIALTFARTETHTFQKLVFPYANALLFIYGRIYFYHVNGIRAGNAGAPSVLIAYGKENAESLKKSNIKGYYVELR